MPRNKTIPETIILQEIKSFVYEKDHGVRITLGTGVVNVDGDFEFDVPQQFQDIDIRGDDYAELLSANPTWSPLKPEKTFRLDDLYLLLDFLNK